MTVQVPDFGALAGQQQAANDDATRRTTWSSRPDQYNAMGSTQWNQSPDGRWTTQQGLNGAAQGLFNTTLAGQQNLGNQVGAGLDYSSLGSMPQVGGYNQQVIDSWNALQRPGLDQQATASRNRLAAQGITQGSTIANNNERNIGNTWTDASNKAILAGYTQGNTEYDQALRGRQQGATELQNKFGAAQSGMSALTGVRDSLNPNKWNADVPQGAAYTPQTVYGAAQDTFNANRMNENADIAARNTGISQGVGAASALLGNQGLAGAGSLLSGVGSAASGLWDWGKNLYNSWGQSSNSNFITPDDWEAQNY